jgi:GT2 family glycosyltransferase
VSRVYIVIVNWNGWRDTVECLESLMLLDYHDFRIVVCDNGSKDESLIKLRQWGEERSSDNPFFWKEYNRTDAENGGNARDAVFTLIENGSNLGFGGGTNVGLRFAQARGDADYCWLLNNDTVVDSKALAAMVARFVEKPGAGMCGSTLRDYVNRTHIQALGGATYFKWLGVAWHIGRTLRGDESVNPDLIENKMDYVVGSSLLVRASFLRDIGLMAEDYFLYFEELDWALRGKSCFGLAYAPQSVVYHKTGASIGTATNPRRKSYQCDYYTLRNRLLFTRRYYPVALGSVYAGLMVELLVRLLLGRWDLALMICHLLFYGVNESDIRLTRDEVIS